MSRKRTLSPASQSSNTPTTAEAVTTRSAPITDRASTFVALFSPTAVPRTLQSDPSLADASHRILAWRVPSTQRTLATYSSQQPRRVYDTGHDDDGERYAGKKLGTLLETMRVEGAVVVGRWYGGVLLGPVRFAHIEAVAREAIQKAGVGGSSSGGVEGGDAKRTKVDEEATRAKLAEILSKRDQSIEALRGMLAEKIAIAGGAKDGTASAKPTPKKPPLDYNAMPLAALQRLEKARDATIGWVLKEIKKAERSAEDKEGKEEENGSEEKDEEDDNERDEKTADA